MDQAPRSDNDGYNNLFPDSQTYHAYDPSFLNGDPTLPDASWGINASSQFLDTNSSRVQQPMPSWQANANHLSTTSAQSDAYSRSLSHSPVPFGQNNFSNYAPPNTVQYRQQSTYDPALFSTAASGQNFNASYGGYSNQNLGTIAPQALQHSAPSPAPNDNAYAGMNYPQNSFGQQRNAAALAPQNIDQRALWASIPNGVDDGYMSTINFDQMVRATNSERMAPYLTIGKETQEWPLNRTTTIPAYGPRKSKNDLRKLAGNDAALLAKIGKKSLKKERQSPHFANIKSGGSPQERIKYDGESSSSEEPSDDDDSSYTSDEDLEPSPLPTKRPDSPRGAVEYDTIKALWRSKRKSIPAKDIRQALVDFWEIVKTIRDRWKTDAAAVVEAEKKGRTGELPLLGSRVKDQRDMVEVALKAALKHGHRSIVELLGENASLVFLCYQFLLDRFKVEELNGPLARTILELMSSFTTVTEELLEKTHLDKVLPRFVKKGDAKTQYWAKRIIANAATATKQKATASPVEKADTTLKDVKIASPQPKRAEPGPVAGVKRAASNVGEGSALKKVATTAPKANGPASASTTKTNPLIKKATAAIQPVKTIVPAAKPKQVAAKPSSSFFSSLSATKKPGTSIKSGTPAQAAGVKAPEKKPVASTVPKFSFAETMATISNKPKEEKPTTTKPEKSSPPESPEQKAKRLRKEARRKLHVAFKVGGELEQIKYFTHVPEEEEGHDDSQMRDVTDVGGEGRMLKMHAADQMDIDDEEEEDVVQSLVDFRPPHPIDFSVIDLEERDRNYVQRGGKLEPESAERAEREQYEADTLIVFYTEEKDIPANPREPSDQTSDAPPSEIKQIGQPEKKYADRAKHRKAMQPQRYQTAQPPMQNPPFDLSALGQFVNHQQQAAHQAQLPTQAPQLPANVDISKLLASLQPSMQPQHQPPPTMTMPPFPQFHPQAQPQMAPPQPNGQTLDIASILAAIGGGATQAPTMGMPAFGGGAGGVPPPMDGSMDGGVDGGRSRWRDQGDGNKFYKTKGDGCTYLHEDGGS
ncbi:hypothetical protein LTR78_001492 [Recurvomyces mirabilis]|uniref:Uncharacterized protein n=1 Tax=Recurvomyces mirabilis TaxID=574656 RepID=A0AAE0WWB5_9PEZI|nr:hypothetical protein LTR78_001492 [Recurvomyces mirabilis]KAK5161471.1 hypothetical protein LTS14_001267 [Recurvomyces mirabilis]